MYGSQYRGAAAFVAALAVNFVIGVPLVLLVGGVGVAVATIAAELVRYALLARFVDRATDGAVTWLPPLLKRQCVAAVVTAAVVVTATATLPATTLVLAGVIAAAIAVYAAALLALAGRSSTRFAEYGFGHLTE